MTHPSSLRTRADFLTATGVLLVVRDPPPANPPAPGQPAAVPGNPAEGVEILLALWDDGRVTALHGHVDLGTGIKTAFAQIVAEELDLPGGHDGIIELPADAPVGEPYAKWAKLDDPVIEINLTPNRADATGVHGIARDLAAAGVRLREWREILTVQQDALRALFRELYTSVEGASPEERAARLEKEAA